ncbi:UDP-glucoronosyl and UDP-glucosyl transferase domain-containing protein [Phthorimaea operculella]|nr:UDP-glucoronosyl and UDP-glucosyl transferase domain-containing protein [Phthorimaea operculella]
MKLLTVILCVSFITSSKGARILVYIPMPSISHQEPFRPLIQELARRGHDVVAITTDPAFPKGKAPANLTEIDLHDLPYKSIAENMSLLPTASKDDFNGMIKGVFCFVIEVLKQQFETKEVSEVIRDGKFDLLILEAFTRPLLGITHIIKAPVILVSSLGPIFYNAEAMGIPTHPILYAGAIRQKIYNLSNWEKLRELYNQYKIQRAMIDMEEAEHKMLQKHFGNDMPSINELINNIDMLFVNTHPMFGGNYPVPPSVVYMWGIHQKPQKDLPDDLKSFLDSSKHGVIYMSFGSNIDPTIFPEETIQMFVKVFCQLPYDVLWKWSQDELPGRCPNIRIGKWFPQSDLLRHPKVKLFVTQGGMQSTDEAITAGVPLIGMPVMGDQFYNVEKYKHLKIGLGLDLETVTEEQFKDAVTTVIVDESYRKNIKRLDTLMRDEPMSGLQRAVWWTEHVLRHGGARHLRAPAANISWAEYFELKLVAVLLTGCVVILVTAIVIFCLVYKSLRNLFTNVKQKKQ